MVDQRGFWGVVRAHWVAIVAFGLLGIMGGAAFALVSTPEYSAETELFVTAEAGDSTSDLAQGSNFSQQQARNYSVVATREAVLAPVIVALGLDMTPGQLARQVSASVPLNTSLISISVTDESPDRAAAIANAVARSLNDTVLELVPKRSDGTSPIRMEAIQSATPPTDPSAPNVNMLIVLGLLLGLALGVAGAVLLELATGKVRTVEQVKQLAGLTIIGTVVADRSAALMPVLTQADSLSTRAEEFRQIRTNLRYLQAGEGHKVFVVTSSIPGEGKSTTAANMAATLAANGTKVCLVEADLRKPSLARYLDLEGAVGLTTVLAQDARLDEAMQSWGPDDVQVLLSGQIPPNPSELLGSKEALNLINTLRRRFDVVILDCPPLVPVTDAAILGRAFGGVLLVVGAGRVQTKELRKSLDTLAASGTAVLGAIVNRASASSMGRYSQAYRIEETPKKRSRFSRREAATQE